MTSAYDQCGLLVPTRISNGYRVYKQADIDRLQQILFYRELGVGLTEIKQILSDVNFNQLAALNDHLSSLKNRREQLNLLIDNVEKTIRNQKGEVFMTDKEKFEGFKQIMIDENEAAYGNEIREKYGEDAVSASNKKIKNMSSEQWEKAQALSALINEKLKIAVESGNPSGETAQETCDLHRQWLCMFWKDGAYSRESHLGLSQMYCDDERFKKYYEAVVPGAAEFLFEAMKIYCAV